jgi:hypothetical protein
MRAQSWSRIAERGQDLGAHQVAQLVRLPGAPPEQRPQPIRPRQPNLFGQLPTGLARDARQRDVEEQTRRASEFGTAERTRKARLE